MAGTDLFSASDWLASLMTSYYVTPGTCSNAAPDDKSATPANHSEAAAVGPSSDKFKPRKFAKTEYVMRSMV